MYQVSTEMLWDNFLEKKLMIKAKQSKTIQLYHISMISSIIKEAVPNVIHDERAKEDVIDFIGLLILNPVIADDYVFLEANKYPFEFIAEKLNNGNYTIYYSVNPHKFVSQIKSQT